MIGAARMICENVHKHKVKTSSWSREWTDVERRKRPWRGSFWGSKSYPLIFSEFRAAVMCIGTFPTVPRSSPAPSG